MPASRRLWEVGAGLVIGYGWWIMKGPRAASFLGAIAKKIKKGLPVCQISLNYVYMFDMALHSGIGQINCWTLFQTVSEGILKHH